MTDEPDDPETWMSDVMRFQRDKAATSYVNELRNMQPMTAEQPDAIKLNFSLVEEVRLLDLGEMGTRGIDGAQWLQELTGIQRQRW